MKQQRTPGASQRGFTLIELMMTLVIAVILMAVGIPQFRNMTASSRLSSQTMDMIGAVNMARSEAIRRNRTITFCRVASQTATACVTSAGSWGHWIVGIPNATPANATIIKRDVVNTFGTTIKVTSSLSNDTMTFGSDGLARTNNTLVTGDTRYFSICTTRPQNNNNFRTATLGAGSRITTTKSSGTC